MKLVFLYLSLLLSATNATPIKPDIYDHLLDKDGNSGPCRGSSASDKVDSKSKGGTTQEDCEVECDSLASCVAYSYAAGSEGGFCIIYGAGQDGSCTNYDAEIEDHCGSCSVDGKMSKGTCGSCVIPDGTPIYAGASGYADNEGLCKLQSGTWTEGSWTAGDWVKPADGWTGDSHLTTHVNFVTSVDGYDCYDKDRSDHLPKCNGTTDAGSSCQTRFAEEIEGKNLEDLTEGDCTPGGSGCTFIPAPVPPASISFVHSPITTTAGWNAHNVPIGDSLNDDIPIPLGACRSEGTKIAPPTQKDCRYDECRATNGLNVGTQEGCKQACLDDPSGTCVAYSHADNSYCVIHGPHAHVHDTHSNSFAGETWQDTWAVRDRTLKFCLGNIPDNPPGCSNCDSAKPNAKYMCQTLKTDHTRWEAYKGFGLDDAGRDVSVTVMITGGTAGLDADLLRKRIADLAFWKDDDTSFSTTDEIIVTKLEFVLGNLLPGSAEPMMRLINGQFDESSTDTLLAGALPEDVQVTAVYARVVPTAVSARAVPTSDGSSAFVQTFIGTVALVLINALAVF